MIRHLILRLWALLPVLFLVSLLAFVLVRWAPGGPFDRDRAQASPELERALRERYHLDEPVWRQFGRFVAGALQGDLGPSLRYRSHRVQEIIIQGMPVSAVLGILAFLAAIAVGLPLGLVGAIQRGGFWDWGSSLVAFLALCIPAFVAGPLLILMFAVRWELFPVALWGGPEHWVLPVATLGIFYGGRVARLVREGMTDALQAACIRTARAKGVSEMNILLRHALPMGVLPLITYSGPLLADLLTGSFVVESLFQLPGLGTLTVNSALNRDYPLIVGLVLVYAALLLLLNLLADLAHAWIDPRIRHD
ncbi:MAG: ABC transporter permease [Verrucomicrobiales bacterium]|nr:ABC transporter permease [Verrucomicrobiales bacterium]